MAALEHAFRLRTVTPPAEGAVPSGGGSGRRERVTGGTSSCSVALGAHDGAESGPSSPRERARAAVASGREGRQDCANGEAGGTIDRMTE